MKRLNSPKHSRKPPCVTAQHYKCHIHSNNKKEKKNPLQYIYNGHTAECMHTMEHFHRWATHTHMHSRTSARQCVCVRRARAPPIDRTVPLPFFFFLCWLFSCSLVDTERRAEHSSISLTAFSRCKIFTRNHTFACQKSFALSLHVPRQSHTATHAHSQHNRMLLWPFILCENNIIIISSILPFVLQWCVLYANAMRCSAETTRRRTQNKWQFNVK